MAMLRDAQQAKRIANLLYFVTLPGNSLAYAEPKPMRD